MLGLHKLTDIDEINRQANCSICGLVKVKLRYKLNKKGNQTYRCRKKWSENRGRKEKEYRKHKKEYCEKCGFIPQHKVQLDVDHIDGNNKNNNLDNLQTLCANCHRLKTLLSNDYIKKEGRI